MDYECHKLIKKLVTSKLLRGQRDCFVEETYQEVPPLIAIKSNNSLVFKPNRAANAIASAAEAM